MECSFLLDSYANEPQVLNEANCLVLQGQHNASKCSVRSKVCWLQAYSVQN